MAESSSNGKNGRNGQMSGTVRERFQDGARIQGAVNDAMRDVRILHKRMGVALVGSVDGKIVSIPPEEIQIDEPPANPDPTL
jgi:hypothetical protein